MRPAPRRSLGVSRTFSQVEPQRYPNRARYPGVRGFRGHRWIVQDLKRGEAVAWTDSGWSPPTALELPVNTVANEYGGWVSPLEGYIYFTSDRYGHADIFRVDAPRRDRRRQGEEQGPSMRLSCWMIGLCCACRPTGSGTESRGRRARAVASRPAAFVLAFGVGVAPTGCSEAGPVESGPTLMVRGSVHTLDGSPPPALVVSVRAQGFSASEAVGAVGAFSVDAPVNRGFDLLVEEQGGGPGRVFPSFRRVGGLQTDWEAVVLLIPTSWTIESGHFRGSPGKPPVALHPGGAPSFFGVRGWAEEFLEAGPVPFSLTTAWWDEESWPIPVYIERDLPGAAAVTPADSALLWSQIRTLEGRLGLDLFRPVRKEDLPVDPVKVDFLLEPIARPHSIRLTVRPERPGKGWGLHTCM